MSCGSQVLVDQTAQDRFSADPPRVEVCGGAMGSVRDALGDALMRPGGVVVLLVLLRTARRCAAPRISTRSRSSRRNVPTSRSQIAFIRGAWTAERAIVVPAAWNTASNEAVKFEPRSRIRNLKSSNRWPGFRARFRACCTVHSPAGCGVTPPRCIRRVPCPVNTSTCSRLSSTVSTCRKSTATIPAAWARRLEGDFLAGELFELADEGALAALAVDA